MLVRSCLGLSSDSFVVRKKLYLEFGNVQTFAAMKGVTFVDACAGLLVLGLSGVVGKCLAWACGKKKFWLFVRFNWTYSFFAAMS